MLRPVDLVNLSPLMKLTSGKPEIVIGLIDGPVAVDHPGFAGVAIRRVSGGRSECRAAACMHGTFVAGILSARRDSQAPAICPGCTLLVRPIFSENARAGQDSPSATPEELAQAILECIGAGAELLNISAALTQIPSAKGQSALLAALDLCAERGVIVVVAAGNQGTVGSTTITRHPWVIAVAACDQRGRPVTLTNLGNSIGRRGLLAPGEAVASLGTGGKGALSGGTSVAAPFVTGAIALLWSKFRSVRAADLRMTVTRAHSERRPTVVPPLLDAMAVHEALAG